MVNTILCKRCLSVIKLLVFCQVQENSPCALRVAGVPAAVGVLAAAGGEREVPAEQAVRHHAQRPQVASGRENQVC